MSIIPPDGKVIIPNNFGAFSEQSIIQFYMLDRDIFGCPRTNQIVCLAKQDKYLIAITSYPPNESDINKTLVSYPQASSSYAYTGVYVPNNYIAGDYGPFYPDKYNIPLTLLYDFVILSAWYILGWVIIAIVTRNHFHPLTLFTAFPLGMGIFTWVLFLACLSGAPLTIWTLVIVYVLLIVPLGILMLHFRQVPYSMLGSNTKLWAGIKLKRLNYLNVLIAFFILFFVLTLVYIAVGRGYSTFDDMAIWSLKGYYMAFKHDLFAAGQASGHGLSYPLNLSLAISSFFLIDMDLLPGSKLAYVLLFISMLACCYWFFRKYNIPRSFALLGILLIISTPVIFEYATFGFANIPFTCYLIIGTLLGIYGITHKQNGLLFIGGLVLSLAGWTRPEGIGFALFLAFIIGVFGFTRNLKPTTFLLFLFVSVSLCGVWMLLGYRYIQGDEIGSAIHGLIKAITSESFSVSSIWTTLTYSWQQFSGSLNWGYVVPLSLVIIMGLLPVMIQRKNTIALTVSLTAVGTFVIPIFMFVTKYYQSNNYLGFLSVSFDRAQFPAVILLIITTILCSGSFYSYSGNKNTDEDTTS